MAKTKKKPVKNKEDRKSKKYTEEKESKKTRKYGDRWEDELSIQNTEGS